MPEQRRIPGGQPGGDAAGQRGGSPVLYQAACLDRLYPRPRWALCEVEFERAHHLDLPLMTLDELYAERRRLWRRLDYDERPDAWFSERLERINDAIQARRRSERTQRPAPRTPAAVDRTGGSFEYVAGKVVRQ